MQLINCLWFGHVHRDFLVIHRWFPVFLDFQTKPQKTSWRHNQPKLGTCPKKAIWKTCKIWEWNPGWVNRKGEFSKVKQCQPTWPFFQQTTDHRFVHPCSTSQVKSEFGVTETSWILAIILATPILEICWPQGGWHFKDTSGTAIGRLGRDHWKDQDARRFHQHHRHWELKEMRRKCCSTPLLNVKIW